MQGKFILDACCGGRMFWENKNHPNAVYQDIRKDVLPLKEQYGMNFSVEPDIIGDFRKMVFEDKQFKLVIFDPPHLMLNKTAWMAKKYGTIKDTDFEADLQAGFKECWRVLDDYGNLIFKWNDQSVAIEKIKPFFPDEPIIFNRVGTKGKSTYWFVFMKIPSSEQPIAPNQNSASQVVNDEHNMGDKVTPSDSPKDASHPSHHPNIIGNFKNPLVSREQLNINR